MAAPLLSEALHQYAETHTTPESNFLAALNRETHVKVDMPQMLSGHLQGAVLSFLSRMMKPKNILEIGTYTGYSAICLAEGLQEGGMLHTIDINEELIDINKKYFSAAGITYKVRQYFGDALEIIPNIEETFDLVFIDADKVNYSNYYDLVYNKVRPGGFIFADNVLYDGEVVLPPAEQSKNGKAIEAFNQKINADDRVRHVLLPVRDGIMLIQKM